MSKIKVPEGMLKAVVGSNHQGHIPRVLEAALQWLSSNPIVPTDGQARALFESWWARDTSAAKTMKIIAVEWQRRMFLEQEPEIPEEVKDLLVSIGSGFHSVWQSKDEYNACILEAFRRGQRSTK